MSSCNSSVYLFLLGYIIYLFLFTAESAINLNVYCTRLDTSEPLPDPPIHPDHVTSHPEAPPTPLPSTQTPIATTPFDMHQTPSTTARIPATGTGVV